MADSMDAFWGRVGLADSMGQVANAGCGCALGDELGADAGATIDATVAMSRVVAQYAALSTQGELLRQMMVAGAQIPCEVWAAYASARQDYITKSQYLFDQLANKNVTIEQVVFSNGKPQVDPNDPTKVVTLRVQAPLRPPAFVGVTQQCPGVPLMSSAAFAGAMGWEPTPIALGSIASSALSALKYAGAGAAMVLTSMGIPLGTAGYSAYKTIKQVSAIWQDYDASPSRILVAYTGCFQAQVQAGVSAVEAAKACSNVQTSAQQARVAVAQANASASANRGLGFWGWLGVGAGVFLLASIGLRVLRSRVGAAARLVSPIGEVDDLGRPRARRKRRAGSATDPILLGDLYLHPRGRH